MLLVALGSSWSSAAAAQPDIALSWVRGPGAESCIALAELAARSEARMAGRAFVAAEEAELNLEGRIAREAAAWVATLAISDRRGNVLGRRTLQSSQPDCRSIDEGLVLVIALALDPSQGFVALPEELTAAADPAESLLGELQSQPQAPPPTAASPPATPALPRSQLPTENAGPSLAAGADLQASLGLVPPIGIGAALFAHLLLMPDEWGFELRAAGHLPSAARPSGGGVVEVGSLLFGAGACVPPVRFADLALRPCAGVSLGLLTIDALELRGARNGARTLVNPYLSAELEYAFGRFGLRARFGLDMPLIRDRIEVLDPESRGKQAWRAAVIVPSLALGFFLRFGS